MSAAPFNWPHQPVINLISGTKKEGWLRAGEPQRRHVALEVVIPTRSKHHAEQLKSLVSCCAQPTDAWLSVTFSLRDSCGKPVVFQQAAGTRQRAEVLTVHTHRAKKNDFVFEVQTVPCVLFHSLKLQDCLQRGFDPENLEKPWPCLDPAVFPTQKFVEAEVTNLDSHPALKLTCKIGTNVSSRRRQMRGLHWKCVVEVGPMNGEAGSRFEAESTQFQYLPTPFKEKDRVDAQFRLLAQSPNNNEFITTADGVVVPLGIAGFSSPDICSPLQPCSFDGPREQPAEPVLFTEDKPMLCTQQAAPRIDQVVTDGKPGDVVLCIGQNLGNPGVHCVLLDQSSQSVLLPRLEQYEVIPGFYVTRIPNTVIAPSQLWIQMCFQSPGQQAMHSETHMIQVVDHQPMDILDDIEWSTIEADDSFADMLQEFDMGL